MVKSAEFDHPDVTIEVELPKRAAQQKSRPNFRGSWLDRELTSGIFGMIERLRQSGHLAPEERRIKVKFVPEDPEGKRDPVAISRK